MAEIEKVMNIALDDIEKLMNIGGDDIEKVNDLEYVTEVVWYGSRGLAIGGGTNSEVIQYKSIASTGNTSDFGDIGNYGDYGGLRDMAIGSNKSRAVHMGGYATNWNNDETHAAQNINNIYYVTVGTTGDSTDAADLTVARKWTVGSTNGTRQLTCGGLNGGVSNVVDYFTIASISNATDFGDLYAGMYGLVGSINNATRAVIGTGITSADSTGTGRMDYFSYATPANASEFGEMVVPGEELGAWGAGGCESDTRGIFFGGASSGATNTALDSIAYITVDTTANSTDFGDMIAVTRYSSGSSATGNATKGEAYAAHTSAGGGTDNIQSITIASTGDAADNGNLLAVNTGVSAISGT